MQHGKCPKCEKVLKSVNVVDVDLIAEYRLPQGLKGVYYLCPFCSSILSVGFDPEDFQRELVNEISRILET